MQNRIADYINAEETKTNIKKATKEDGVKVITWLSNFYNNSKTVRQLTIQDILDYLNNLRKPFGKYCSEMDRLLQWTTNNSQ
ncbi:MAG: hypothetical protein ABJB76_00130 [Candidatus Nitrosocosmicus sp.]